MTFSAMVWLAFKIVAALALAYIAWNLLVALVLILVAVVAAIVGTARR